MNSSLEHALSVFSDADKVDLLTCGRRGIEKEGLRLTQTGDLATTRHPEVLGHPLTHEFITTDYAEALLELVTPVFRNASEMLDYLCFLHRVLTLTEDELMFNASMPPFLADSEAVEIAQYGTSNSGTMKRLYRKGLAVRYGKAMQLIAGIHYNYSICGDTLALLAASRHETYDQRFIDKTYMNLVRNLRKNAWLTVYLFGHSPAADVSFFGNRTHGLELLDDNTVFMPYATSLRMSDIGYQNKVNLHVSANDLTQYVCDLKAAVLTPSSRYDMLGLKNCDGDYQQITTNLLQIENEYYTGVRPKQVGQFGETQLTALHRRGIRYVELRTIDINCFDRCGLSLEQADFLEVFMLYNLLTTAPTADVADERENQHNFATVAAKGRKPNLHLLQKCQDVPLTDIGMAMLDDMVEIAQVLDSQLDTPRFTDNVLKHQAAIEDPEHTPSAKILRELEHGLSYHDFMLSLSKQHDTTSRQRGLSEAERETIRDAAEKSFAEEARLVEKSQQQTFEEYVKAYFAPLAEIK